MLVWSIVSFQVPHSYKGNVCRYRDEARYIYSAMVSSLDHSVEQVSNGSHAMTGNYVNKMS